MKLSQSRKQMIEPPLGLLVLVGIGKAMNFLRLDNSSWGAWLTLCFFVPALLTRFLAPFMLLTCLYEWIRGSIKGDHEAKRWGRSSFFGWGMAWLLTLVPFLYSQFSQYAGYGG